jgi:hypothetical protein
MSLGTPASLSKASNGIFPSRAVANNPATPKTVDPTQPTRTYANILSSAKSGGGLSAKGKYGGFYTSTDQEQAIRGSAINVGRELPKVLESQANTYVGKLGSKYADAYAKYVAPQLASPQAVRTSMMGKELSPRALEEATKPSSIAKDYSNQLIEYTRTQGAPSREYYNTATQLKSKPLSELASEIATSAYGMNPDLATAKFGDLDTQYLKQTRDTESMRRFGIPYDELMAKREDELFGTSAKKELAGQEALAAAALERVTGLGSKYLSANTGQTAAQMTGVLNQEFDFVDPDTNTTTRGSGAYFAEQYSTYLREGNNEAANKLLASIPGDKQDVRRLVDAIKSVMLTKAGKSAIGTMTYESFLNDLGS